MSIETFNKEFLYDECRAVLYQNGTDSLFLTRLGTILSDRIPYKTIVSILDEDNYIYLNDNQIYWLSKGLLEVKKEFELEFNFQSDIDDYYSDNEINEAEQYMILEKDTNEVDDLITIINNVDKVTSNVYLSTKTTLGEIVDWYKRNKILYYFKTQRKATLVNTGLGNVYQPTIYRKNVEEISERMVDRNFFSNTITLNVLATGEEKFDYIPEKKQFIHYKDKRSQLNIADGMHRILGGCKALEKDPSLANMIMYVQIFNFDAPTTLNYINQESKGAPRDSEVARMPLNDNVTDAIDFLNTDRNSLLRNQISKIDEEVYNLKTKYVHYNTLFKIIDEVYLDFKKVKSQSKINNSIRQLSDVLNFIIEEQESFKIKENQDNIFLDSNMFIGYVWLAYKCQEVDDWQDKIKVLLNKIKDNERLITFAKNSRRTDTAFRKQVRKNFELMWYSLFRRVK